MKNQMIKLQRNKEGKLEVSEITKGRKSNSKEKTKRCLNEWKKIKKYLNKVITKKIIFSYNKINKFNN